MDWNDGMEWNGMEWNGTFQWLRPYPIYCFRLDVDISIASTRNMVALRLKEGLYIAVIHR